MTRARSRVALGMAAVAAGALVVWLWARRATLETGTVARPASATSRGRVAALPAHSSRSRVTRPALKPPTVRSAPATSGDRRPPHAPIVLGARWGSAPGEVGRSAPREGNPEGPMAFAVGPDRRSYILDQVNRRISVFTGPNHLRDIPLPTDTFQDVVAAPSGNLQVLDRLVTKSIAIVDEAGDIVREVGIEGKGVPDAGLVTAIFAREDGTWAEVNHMNLVRIVDAGEKRDPERPVAAGRFTHEAGTNLRAVRSGSGVTISRIVEGRERALARVDFSMKIAHLIGLETDARSRIYVGATLYTEQSSAPFEVTAVGETVVVLDRDGKELRLIELPAPEGPEETLRRMTRGADGYVYHLTFDDQGISVRQLIP